MNKIEKKNPPTKRFGVIAGIIILFTCYQIASLNQKKWIEHKIEGANISISAPGNWIAIEDLPFEKIKELTGSKEKLTADTTLTQKDVEEVNESKLFSLKDPDSPNLRIQISRLTNIKQEFNSLEEYHESQISQYKDLEFFKNGTLKINHCPKINIKDYSSLYVNTTYKNQTLNMYVYSTFLDNDLILIAITFKKESSTLKDIIKSIKEIS